MRESPESGVQDEKILLFADFTLDLARGSLLSAGEPVHLRPQAFEILKYLVENRGRLVSKDRLVEAVWQGRAVTDDALVQCLMEVRRALGAEGKLHLRNVRGRGYIFDTQVGEKEQRTTSEAVWTQQVDLLRVVVEEEEATGGESDSRSPSPPVPTAARIKLGRVNGKVIILTAACLLVAGLAMGAYFSFRRGSDKVSNAHHVRSLAVLPFKPLVAEGRDEVLEVGMADTLIAKLSNIGDITVRPLSAVRRYGGLDQDPFTAGSQLNVEAVLDGTIQRSGESVGVRARLVRVKDEKQLWEGRFNSSFTNIFSVQDAISEKVAAALALRLTTDERKRLTRHDTQNPEAYQLYLYGRFYRNKRTEEGTRTAIEYFEKAIARDSNSALAYAGLSEGYIGLADQGNYWIDRSRVMFQPMTSRKSTRRWATETRHSHGSKRLMRIGHGGWTSRVSIRPSMRFAETPALLHFPDAWVVSRRVGHVATCLRPKNITAEKIEKTGNYDRI